MHDHGVYSPTNVHHLPQLSVLLQCSNANPHVTSLKTDPGLLLGVTSSFLVILAFDQEQGEPEKVAHIKLQSQVGQSQFQYSLVKGNSCGRGANLQPCRGLRGHQDLHPLGLHRCSGGCKRCPRHSLRLRAPQRRLQHTTPSLSQPQQ